jgi:hypothetical protein
MLRKQKLRLVNSKTWVFGIFPSLSEALAVPVYDLCLFCPLLQAFLFSNLSNDEILFGGDGRLLRSPRSG